ncbi:hypothetical protein EVA_10386 [gut metagenome]|uniref:Uncharacterized protein n=1 Tax=gut metagenome TaxID=749906 RepID=J9G3T9_9ZZZZ
MDNASNSTGIIAFRNGHSSNHTITQAIGCSGPSRNFGIFVNGYFFRVVFSYFRIFRCTIGNDF